MDQPMNYLNIGLDNPVSIFDICQAHAQLESDYNIGGIVIARPSNKRRNESTSCQLVRLGYSDTYRWVDITGDDDDCDDCGDDNVRSIYMRNVLNWGLPIDAALMVKIKSYFVQGFTAKYPQCLGLDYLQGKN